MDPLPPGSDAVVAASHAGWSGLSLVESAGGATLVASVDEGARRAATPWLSMSVETRERPRLLRFRLLCGDEDGTDDLMTWAPGSAALDLAYPEGRRIVERLVAGGLLWLVVLESGSGEVTCTEHVHLAGGATVFLRDASARAAEWFAEATGPPELDGDAWTRACRRAPCLAPSAEDMGAVLVVPPGALAGFEGGHIEISIGPPADGDGWGGLVVGIARGDDRRAFALDLGGACQRRLAWRLAHQHEVTILEAAPDGARAAGARAVSVLGPVARALLHRAGRER